MNRRRPTRFVLQRAWYILFVLMLLCSTRPDMTHVAARSLDTDTSVTLYSADPAPQPLLEVRTPVQQDNSKNRQNEGPEPAACTHPAALPRQSGRVDCPCSRQQHASPSLRHSGLAAPPSRPSSCLTNLLCPFFWTDIVRRNAPRSPSPYILQSSFPSAA